MRRLMAVILMVMILAVCGCGGPTTQDVLVATQEHCSIFPQENIEVFIIFIESFKDQGATELDLLLLVPEVCMDDPISSDGCVICGTHLVDEIYGS